MVFETVFKVDEVELAEAEVKLRAIAAKDDSFKYSVRKTRSGYWIVVFSKDKDTAYKRGVWLSKKALNGKLFLVRERQ